MTIYEKLVELYPNCIDGYLGGRACAIVGQLGLEVCTYNPDVSKCCHRYVHNDKLGITSFSKGGMIVQTAYGNTPVEYDKFKGISWEVKVRELKN